jgi:hypothetical protein
MQLQRIKYPELNAKQKEIYNYQKVAALLADYGFNCMKLSDDWQGADFLAYHKDGKDTLKVQLKARMTIDQKYSGQDLYVVFPVKKTWYLIEHDTLVRLVGEHSNWLNTKSWKEMHGYSSDAPNETLLGSLDQYALKSA